ncbi:hypothetical protein DCO56_08290 [Sphingobacterium athyrii]|uniref:Thioredoxin-like fold domain-containing protein n=1 Tax=Sphingobacterium athyrii TaxID=2152717 RepID=A0A363NW37_9SPHI|nr:hypothetical protein DCO56_08290 [Sphingobacterium athyrii]
MGPGFESQRDHRGKANRKISFFCLKGLGFERRAGRVRSVGGSGMCTGTVGLSQSQRDHSFIRKNIPEYPSFWDSDKSLSKSLGVFGYPFVMLLDRERKLLYQGALDSKALSDILLNLQ